MSVPVLATKLYGSPSRSEIVVCSRPAERLNHGLQPQMHLVIATREDPPLPLARLRARGQLAELRASDLRFTTDEAAQFLNQVMGLKLSSTVRAVACN